MMRIIKANMLGCRQLLVSVIGDRGSVDADPRYLIPDPQPGDSMTIQDQIKQTISENAIVLFMKGTADFPQCGFSSKVVQILRDCNVAFKDINVLTDAMIRQGIKDYTNWPTIPQLYIRGEFVGGCDIVTELFESGELKKLLHNEK